MVSTTGRTLDPRAPSSSIMPRLPRSGGDDFGGSEQAAVHLADRHELAVGSMGAAFPRLLELRRPRQPDRLAATQLLRERRSDIDPRQVGDGDANVEYRHPRILQRAQRFE